jgi:type IV pilus assembly protein PilA
MQNQRGFTLIELMVVTAIIAILAAIAISAYATAIGKTQFSEALSVTDGIKPDISSYYHQNGACPGAGDGSILPPTSYAGKYVASVTVASAADGCTVTALFRSSSVAPDLRGKQVVLTLEHPQNAGSAVWICSSNAPEKYVPEPCR